MCYSLYFIVDHTVVLVVMEVNLSNIHHNRTILHNMAQVPVQAAVVVVIQAAAVEVATVAITKAPHMQPHIRLAAMEAAAVEAEGVIPMVLVVTEVLPAAEAAVATVLVVTAVVVLHIIHRLEVVLKIEDIRPVEVEATVSFLFCVN